MTTRRTLVLGLDAFDRTLSDQLMDEGLLPNLARLTAEGHVADMVNPYGILTGPVWPTIMTGATIVNHGAWTWRQLVPGTYRKRYLGPNAGAARSPLWKPLSEEGVRCSIVDVPRFPLCRLTNGEHIVAFRQHDSPDLDHGFEASPQGLARHIAEDFEIYFDRCDEHRDAGTYCELWKELCLGIDQKVELLDVLWSRTPPELGIAVFPESHCAGHQFWLEGDADQPTQGSIGPPDHLLNDVYTRLDAAVGHLVENHAGADTSVVVVMSHGMGNVKPVSRLLTPVLEAIDDLMGRTGILWRGRAFTERLPNRLARAGLKLAGREIEQLDHWVDSSRRFFPISVFPTFGAVRLNLVGREPRGLVSPHDRAAVLDLLESQLLELCDVDTGEPLVKRVDHISEHHPSKSDVGLPDIIFEWANAGHVVRGATSPSLGLVTATPERMRHGNHLRDGRVIVFGPGIEPTRGAPVRAEDVAPTVAGLIGHDLPGVDGQSFLPERAIKRQFL